jgi:lysophospholipase L1-like esterase
MTGGDYTVTPSKPGYGFAPSARTFARLASDGNADFGVAPPTVSVFGDSISQNLGFTSSPQNLFWYRLIAEWGTGFGSIYGEGGTCAPDHQWNLFGRDVTGGAGDIYLIEFGANDMRNHYVGDNSRAQYGDALFSYAAFLSVPPSNKFVATDTAHINYVGTSWGNDFFNSRGLRAMNRNSATGDAETHVARATVSGTVVFVGTEYTVNDPATFTVHIDGVLKGAFSNAAPAGQIAGIYANTWGLAPRAVAFSDLPAGKHTVVVTVTSASPSAFYLDWIGGNATVSPSTVYVFGAPPQRDARAYAATGVTPQEVADFTGEVANLAATLRGYGLRVFAVDLTDALIPATDYNPDGVHPNDTGHLHMQQKVDAVRAANP